MARICALEWSQSASRARPSASQDWGLIDIIFMSSVFCVLLSKPNTRSLGAAFLLILVEQHRKLAKRVV